MPQACYCEVPKNQPLGSRSALLSTMELTGREEPRPKFRGCGPHLQYDQKVPVTFCWQRRRTRHTRSMGRGRARHNQGRREPPCMTKYFPQADCQKGTSQNRRRKRKSCLRPWSRDGLSPSSPAPQIDLDTSWTWRPPKDKADWIKKWYEH